MTTETPSVDEARTCKFCGAEAEQGMDYGDGAVVWTCAGHEPNGAPVDPVRQARRRYNRAVSDHYSNMYGDEVWEGTPQTETYTRMKALGEAYEAAVRAEAIRERDESIAVLRRLQAAYASEECEHGFPFNFGLRDAHRAARAFLARFPEAEGGEG